MKKRLIAGCLAAAALTVASFGTQAYAASGLPAVNPATAQAQESSDTRISIREMGFEGSSVLPVYVDNSTNENPDDMWVEIRNSAGEVLLVIDKAETKIDEVTGLLMVSKAYYESSIKPIIENGK
jgi:predicted aspartyl protease